MYNAFDCYMAYQFLSISDDLSDIEELREVYRHIQRVLNSPSSSAMAKKLINGCNKYIAQNPNESKISLIKSCRNILIKSDISAFFDETVSEKIQRYAR